MYSKYFYLWTFEKYSKYFTVEAKRTNIYLEVNTGVCLVDNAIDCLPNQLSFDKYCVIDIDCCPLSTRVLGNVNFERAFYFLKQDRTLKFVLYKNVPPCPTMQSSTTSCSPKPMVNDATPHYSQRMAITLLKSIMYDDIRHDEH